MTLRIKCWNFAACIFLVSAFICDIPEVEAKKRRYRQEAPRVHKYSEPTSRSQTNESPSETLIPLVLTREEEESDLVVGHPLPGQDGFVIAPSQDRRSESNLFFKDANGIAEYFGCVTFVEPKVPSENGKLNRLFNENKLARLIAAGTIIRLAPSTRVHVLGAFAYGNGTRCRKVRVLSGSHAGSILFALDLELDVVDIPSMTDTQEAAFRERNKETFVRYFGMHDKSVVPRYVRHSETECNSINGGMQAAASNSSSVTDRSKGQVQAEDDDELTGEGFYFNSIKLGVSLPKFLALTRAKRWIVSEIPKNRDESLLGDGVSYILRISPGGDPCRYCGAIFYPRFRFVNCNGVFRLRAIDAPLSTGSSGKLILRSLAKTYGSPKMHGNDAFFWTLGVNHPTLIQVTPSGSIGSTTLSFVDVELTQLAVDQQKQSE